MLALKYMGKPNGGRGGTVVQMCSTAAFIGVSSPLYVSTKRAVYEYSRCIGVRDNIRESVLQKGYDQRASSQFGGRGSVENPKFKFF